MQQNIHFQSSGLKLAGVLHIPDDLKPGEQRPSITVLHGFGSNKNGGIALVAAELFEKMGYVTLRFDFRGCGQSEGPPGRVICLEQVDDARAAFDYLETRAEVDPKRMAIMGFSFGAAVSVYTAGIESRAAACISMGGWGDGAKKFRKQHESPQAWEKFTSMMKRGQEELKKGVSIQVPRFDIVPIRAGIRNNLAEGAFMEFPFEVVQSMYDFKANDVVAQIAPRPLLLMHPSLDTVTPTEQSVDLFLRAGQPTELHLMAEVDHFMLSENNRIVHAVLSNWLDKYFPLHVSPN
jgi:alpha/beta superfamily hydrolase